MSEQSVIISCPECGTKFRFELSEKHIKRPNKRLKMRCYVCAHQFGVKPKELLGSSSNPSESFIRIQSAFGLKNFRSWDEIREQFSQVELRSSDPVSVFGGAWTELGTCAEISDLFSEPKEHLEFSEEELNDRVQNNDGQKAEREAELEAQREAERESELEAQRAAQRIAEREAELEAQRIAEQEAEHQPKLEEQEIDDDVQNNEEQDLKSSEDDTKLIEGSSDNFFADIQFEFSNTEDMWNDFSEDFFTEEAANTPLSEDLAALEEQKTLAPMNSEDFLSSLALDEIEDLDSDIQEQPSPESIEKQEDQEGLFNEEVLDEEIFNEEINDEELDQDSGLSFQDEEFTGFGTEDLEGDEDIFGEGFEFSEDEFWDNSEDQGFEENREDLQESREESREENRKESRKENRKENREEDSDHDLEEEREESQYQTTSTEFNSEEEEFEATIFSFSSEQHEATPTIVGAESFQEAFGEEFEAEFEDAFSQEFESSVEGNFFGDIDFEGGFEDLDDLNEESIDSLDESALQLSRGTSKAKEEKVESNTDVEWEDDPDPSEGWEGNFFASEFDSERNNEEEFISDEYALSDESAEDDLDDDFMNSEDNILDELSLTSDPELSEESSYDLQAYLQGKNSSWEDDGGDGFQDIDDYQDTQNVWLKRAIYGLSALSVVALIFFVSTQDGLFEAVGLGTANEKTADVGYKKGSSGEADLENIEEDIKPQGIEQVDNKKDLAQIKKDSVQKKASGNSSKPQETAGQKIEPQAPDTDLDLSSGQVKEDKLFFQEELNIVDLKKQNQRLRIEEEELQISRDAGDLSRQGWIALRNHEDAKATNLFEEALRVNRSFPDALYGLAYARQIQAENANIQNRKKLARQFKQGAVNAYCLLLEQPQITRDTINEVQGRVFHLGGSCS